MSNDLIKYPSSTERTPAGLFEHWCQHPGCAKWGQRGFARGGKGESVWFCYEHREDGERYL
ncbi:hypothetical protein EOA88_35590 [Mesorhizobium sp. M5C.F.Ca.IN.020.14.1.1]|nr:hypothetical protein EOA88_35590 [Mesorhizobium sp. M5C.F.Ca.IN.020.14.1.1]